ncbi:MAG: hypothetical protein MH321_03170 [Leptospiraceae bacterium]|nr:hypothetical protein [Leptospiraceae bacterium]
MKKLVTKLLLIVMTMLFFNCISPNSKFKKCHEEKLNLTLIYSLSLDNSKESEKNLLVGLQLFELNEERCINKQKKF